MFTTPLNSLFSMFRPKEFEHISNREYLKLLDRATLRRGDAAWLIPAACGIVGIAGWLVVSYLIGKLVSRPGTQVFSSNVSMANAIMSVLIFLPVYAVVRWRMLTSSVRRLLNRAACPYCEFSLMGLEVQMGGVVCPECGERTILSELGLTKEDLIPHTIAMTPFDGAGRLGSYAGAAPPREAKRIRPDKTAGLPKKKTAAPAPPTDVTL